MKPITVSKLTDSHGSMKTTVPQEVIQKASDDFDGESPRKILWKEDSKGRILVDIS